MHKFILTALLLMAAFYSNLVFAKCEQLREQQQIHIKNLAGIIQIEHKDASRDCIVVNNRSNHANNGSRVVWVFHNLDCQPGECRIELEGNPSLPNGVLRCDIGNPNARRCHLLVNRLKNHCDSLPPTTVEECRFNYMIKVRNEEIDPSIIIRPSPSSI